jgi:hypothetical protein
MDRTAAPAMASTTPARSERRGEDAGDGSSPI